MNGFAWSPSIIPNASLLDNIFEYLSTIKHRFDAIFIFDPMNKNEEIKKVMDEYKSLFDAIQFDLKLGEHNHPQYGICDYVGIVHK